MNPVAHLSAVAAATVFNQFSRRRILRRFLAHLSTDYAWCHPEYHGYPIRRGWRRHLRHRSMKFTVGPGKFPTSYSSPVASHRAQSAPSCSSVSAPGYGSASKLDSTFSLTPRDLSRHARTSPSRGQILGKSKKEAPFYGAWSGGADGTRTRHPRRLLAIDGITVAFWSA